MSDDRFDRIDQTLDRLLTISLEQGGAIAELKADTRGLRQDMASMRLALDGVRKEVAGIHEAFTEHLGWHLGQR